MKINRMFLASIMASLFEVLLRSIPFVTPENMNVGAEFTVYFLCMYEILKYSEK